MTGLFIDFTFQDKNFVEVGLSGVKPLCAIYPIQTGKCSGPGNCKVEREKKKEKKKKHKQRKQKNPIKANIQTYPQQTTIQYNTIQLTQVPCPGPHPQTMETAGKKTLRFPVRRRKAPTIYSTPNT